MLYSKKRNFTFIHVWKTAGESIVDALRPECEFPFNNRYYTKIARGVPERVAKIPGWRTHLIHGQHLVAQDIRDIMPDGIYDQTYSFGFVRNPWDWTVSAFQYAKQTKANPDHEIAKKMSSLRDYVSFRSDNYLRTQSSFLFDDKGKQIVTKIGRFENLTEDFNEILTDLGIETQLAKRNESARRKDWRSYYDDTTYDKVAHMYRRDISLLGYAA